MSTGSGNDGSQPGVTHTAVMPAMLYGTAWKKDRTADLVYEAIKAGFRGIDTAHMKKHYNEAGAGEGIRRAIDEGLVTRSDLWIQTKYTPDDEPYASSPSTPTITSQVLASVSASLDNLSPATYLDALVLHSPFPDLPSTLEAWSALCTLVPSRIRTLGISNVTLPTLRALEKAPVPPLIIQNRIRRVERAFDIDTRRWVASRAQLGTRYQGFWTLTGNRGEWQTAEFVGRVASGTGVERPTAWYALLLAADVVVLNGTTSQEHMRGDLEGLEKVKAWRETETGKEMWDGCWREFVEMIGM
ncbi:NADP-dependent oxidoreductase domain-containing protein [Cercophora newfieldiana]|uniref:NADP-dependent oxidoreductase domain-containing protein n=1 Tax=Cercophora newfieldiana TaxID=92897 RepID=A0AA40CHR1_9PEZI|nr:NADP-dependent oxidoreductase domain-containing protein [Cercophora newfieldiana]